MSEKKSAKELWNTIITKAKANLPVILIGVLVLAMIGPGIIKNMEYNDNVAKCNIMEVTGRVIKKDVQESDHLLRIEYLESHLRDPGPGPEIRFGYSRVVEVGEEIIIGIVDERIQLTKHGEIIILSCAEGAGMFFNCSLKNLTGE